MRLRPLFLVFALACSSVVPVEEKGPAPLPASVSSAPQTPLVALQNADFSQWKDGLPVGWEVLNGAGAAGVPSDVSALPAGGLALSGDASTTQWRVVAQSFPVKPGAWYRLEFTASVSLLQPGPFVNHWVGLAFFDEKRLGAEIASLEEGEGGAQRFYVRAPETAKTAQVQLFLSMPGRLEAKNVSLAALGPAESFEILVGDMARKYSFFAIRQIDWSALSAKYKAEAEATKDPQAFAAVVVKMLAELQDLHIFVTGPDQKPLYTVTKHPEPNVDLKVTRARLLNEKIVGKSALSASLAGGFGYVGVFSMQTKNADEFTGVSTLFSEALKAPGLVLDLRGNTGGAEALGQSLVGQLTAQRLVYGKVAYRNGVAFDRFGPPLDKILEPLGGGYTGKVAVLVGPVCVSSCEGMVMMLKMLPNAKLFGQTTRGASGNPQPVLLPNGVSVTYPRWKAMLPDGTPIETRGIAPEVVVEHTAGADPTLDAALQWLQEPLP